MFLGDKGKPSKFNNVRKNYEIIIDEEKRTLKKIINNLGFFSVVSDGKINETHIFYDTERKLLTGAGLILQKKVLPERTYFSLVRISEMALQNREKKSFLGECEPNDEPSDFPVQIADGINKIFNNLFAVNLIEVVKHCTPYIKTGISGNRYRIVSGTGYKVEMAFESLNIKDYRTGKKAKKRIFTLEMNDDPDFEQEREHILKCIEKNCKELLFVNRNNFEISEVAVRIPQVKTTQDGKKVKEKKKTKKELKEEQKKANDQE